MHVHIDPTILLAASSWHIIGGIALIVVWLIGCVAWTLMSGMANLMANDSGSASNRSHMRLIITMLIGQALMAAAGVFAGCAIMSDDHRSRLLWWFGGLLVTGIIAQAFALYSFFSRRQ